MFAPGIWMQILSLGVVGQRSGCLSLCLCLPVAAAAAGLPSVLGRALCSVCLGLSLVFLSTWILNISAALVVLAFLFPELEGGLCWQLNWSPPLGGV